LLRGRPVEAGVDPVFQELAQPDAMRVFGGVFRRWIERRLATPSPALTRALARVAWREGRDTAPLDALRSVTPAAQRRSRRHAPTGRGSPPLESRPW